MQLKVLYLDDEGDLCDIFSDEFSSDEIMITTFTDPAAAKAAACSSQPDIIFLDYRLPGTNGDLIAQDMPAAIPKYLITGDAAVSTVYPFVSVLPKPYKRDLIHAALADRLKLMKAA